MPDDNPQLRQVALPLEHHWAENAVTRFASEFSIQIGQGVCYLSFYEVIPPLLVGSPEEIQAKVASMGSIRAEGIVRVVVTAEKLQEILNAIQSTVGPASPGGSEEIESKEAPK
jgi:hypothetical protein